MKSECGFIFSIYSICAVVTGFITRIRIKENECAFFLFPTSTFPVEKSAFFWRCFIQNWEEIGSLKTEKSPRIVLEKS